MDIVLQHDPALVRFGQAVSSAYGDAVERVVLYGSRARVDARPDSDYDIAVFLHDLPDHADAMNRFADIGTDILYDIGQVVHAMPFPSGVYRDRTALMRDIRRDGVEIKLLSNRSHC